jgi:hypothetical protein
MLLVASLLLLVAAPVAAISQGTILSVFAVLQICGTLGFAYLGMYTSKDFFLLLGNVVCAVGAGVWVLMLLEEEGSPSWITAFIVLGCLSVYAVVVMFNKYRREGLDSDSDDDNDAAEDEGSQPQQQLAKAAASATDVVHRDKKRPDSAAVRRRKK